MQIDGRLGEGGGQILRTALSLSVALGVPIEINHIRAKRRKPGLLRQHLTCVRAAAEVCDGEVQGAELGSSSVTLNPGPAKPGDYRFAIGSAGSTLLVLQTIYPALLAAGAPSTIEIEGGTHNPMAPTFGFVQHCLVPLLASMGQDLEIELLRPGFYPAGGGKLRAKIVPGQARAFELLERGEAGRHTCRIGLAHLPDSIAKSEWKSFAKLTNWPEDLFEHEDLSTAVSPGNVLEAHLRYTHVTQVMTQFGAPGVSGRNLAKSLAGQVKKALRHDAPVVAHLADQLMLPMALLAGGTYRCTGMSLHAETNAQVINMFLPGAVTIGERTPVGVEVTVKGRS